MLRKSLLFLKSLSFERRARPEQRHFIPCIIAVGIIGAMFCWGCYLRSGDQTTKDFWVDESWRAQQILHAVNYQDLLKGNYYGQEGPVQFSEYMFGKVGLLLFGKSEIAFRFWPWLSSIGALFVYIFLCWFLFSPAIACLSAFFFATSIGFVEHAHEFKPYSFEIFASLLTCALFVNLEKNGKRIWWQLLLALGILLCLTNIGIFFLFLAPVAIAHRESQWMLSKKHKAALVAASLLVTGFAFEYISYIVSLKNHQLFRFWSGYYLNSTERVDKIINVVTPTTLYGYILSPFELQKYPHVWTLGFCVLAFIISPGVMLLRRQILSLSILFPLFLQIGLSMCGVYPIMSRVSAFFYPFVLLSISYLLNELWRLISAKNPVIFEFILLAFIGFFVANSIMKMSWQSHAGTHRNLEEIKPLIAELNVRSKKGDVLAQNYPASHATSFYGLRHSGDYVLEPCPDMTGLNEANASVFVADLFDKYRGRTVWLLASRRIKGYSLLKNAFREKNLSVIIDLEKKKAFLLGVDLIQQPSG